MIKGESTALVRKSGGAGGKTPGRRTFARLLRRLPFLVLLLLLAFLLLSTVFPALLAHHPPNAMNPTEALKGPSTEFWLGTDEFGRDIFSRAVYGAQVSVRIGLGAILVAMLIGVPLGLAAGYYAGWADTLIMRLQDALLSFPMVLFAILLIATFGASQTNVIITIGIAYVPRFARLVRGSVLAVKQMEFVEASRAIGATDRRLIFRTIFPNVVPPIIVQATLGVAVAILIEAGLSYLGLGVQPPTPSWGTMLRQAQTYLSLAPWYVLVPGAFIFLTVLVFNLAGDWLRDRLDPRRN